MAKYKQGTAPAVVFENNKVVFAFREGKLEIKDEMVRKNGCELHKKLIKYGAICVAGNPMKVGWLGSGSGDMMPNQQKEGESNR